MGIASHGYHDAKRHLPHHGSEKIPPATAANPTPRWNGLSSQAQLLPYLEDQAVLNLVDQTKHWRDQTQQVKDTPLPFLKCPSQAAVEQTDPLASYSQSPFSVESDLRCHYFAIFGAKPDACPSPGGRIPPGPEGTYTMVHCVPAGTGLPGDGGGMATNGALYLDSDLAFRKITDGLSHTMLYGECSWDAGINMTWLAANDNLGTVDGGNYVFNGKNIVHPINSAPFPELWTLQGGTTVNYHDVSLGSKHPGGCNILMCDGSASFVSDTIELAVLKAMASRGSEEVLTSP
jgi:prepilin-type processing-associated H-X9-DG protein